MSEQRTTSLHRANRASPGQAYGEENGPGAQHVRAGTGSEYGRANGQAGTSSPRPGNCVALQKLSSRTRSPQAALPRAVARRVRRGRGAAHDGRDRGARAATGRLSGRVRCRRASRRSPARRTSASVRARVHRLNGIPPGAPRRARTTRTSGARTRTSRPRAHVLTRAVWRELDREPRHLHPFARRSRRGERRACSGRTEGSRSRRVGMSVVYISGWIIRA